MLKKQLLILFIATLFLSAVHAEEGMWLPILLKKYNLEQMQKDGFKLTAEDIYDINQASLKDAVVGLVRIDRPFHHFCTGNVVSPEGLVMTNHHCGFGAIQSHSSLEHDYLTNGFWAMNKEEELYTEGMGMCFLKRMEDVTNQILTGIPDSANPFVRDSLLNVHITTIEQQAVEGTQYQAKVKPFFSGNAYYLSVYEIFRDIRLVGAPPSAIGKFGGDTDNWMWPRHTGDFSMFRIYANKNNEPADYSPDNVPYHPEKFFEISLDGVKQHDFTMVMGYPGTTSEYLPSFAVSQLVDQVNPARIKIRTTILDIMKTAMETSPAIRIQYASKAAGIANSWKKWIGENRGLKRMNAIDIKQTQEKEFTQWVMADAERQRRYGTILPSYQNVYQNQAPYELAYNYFRETMLSADLLDLAQEFSVLLKYNKDSDPKKIQNSLDDLSKKTSDFFKDYSQPTDKKLFTAYMQFYYQNVKPELYPDLFAKIQKKYHGDVVAFANELYQESLFRDSTKIKRILKEYTVKSNKQLEKDPALQLIMQAYQVYRGQVRPWLVTYDNQLDELNQLYEKALQEFQGQKTLFPDANSTFRIAYGQVDNYSPADAVNYSYFTTLKGIMEKDNPDIYDYRVPQHLKELYQTKNFGPYGNADSTLNVCFTASNHTTGGNSGSPVLNDKGQLIGLNFDRNWEGTMSDIMYDPEMCRNIILDIRYALFIIDKYAGAENLIKEMLLVKEGKHLNNTVTIPVN